MLKYENVIHFCRKYIWINNYNNQHSIHLIGYQALYDLMKYGVIRQFTN